MTGEFSHKGSVTRKMSPFADVIIFLIHIPVSIPLPAIICPYPPIVTGAEWDIAKGRLYGMVAAYKCLDSFVKHTSSPTETNKMCTQAAMWTGNDIRCVCECTIVTSHVRNGVLDHNQSDCLSKSMFKLANNENIKSPCQCPFCKGTHH